MDDSGLLHDATSAACSVAVECALESIADIMSESVAACLAVVVVAFVVFARYVNRHPDVRKTMKSSSLFWAQFWLHPFIVFAAIYAAGSTGDARYALLLAPFCFNWGMEPWDLPPWLSFYACLYAHHLAPLLACLEAAANCQSAEGAVARALVYGHAWLLHPIGRVSFKQRLFYPYVIQGAAVLAYFGAVVLAAHPIALVPVLVQFSGRLGLYLVIGRGLLGWDWRQALGLRWFKPSDGYYDAFETRKLPCEVAALLASVALARAAAA